MRKAEEVYELIIRLEDWTGGRQKEANVARIEQALDEAKAEGYRMGHEDHQLLAEATAKSAVKNLKVPGELEYTFDGKEIRERIRAEERGRIIAAIKDLK